VEENPLGERVPRGAARRGRWPEWISDWLSQNPASRPGKQKKDVNLEGAKLRI